MSEIIKNKKHLLVKRAKIMKFLLSEDYNYQDIGTIFNIHRSVVSKILTSYEKYKKSAKNILKD